MTLKSFIYRISCGFTNYSYHEAWRVLWDYLVSCTVINLQLKQIAPSSVVLYVISLVPNTTRTLSWRYSNRLMKLRTLLHYSPQGKALFQVGKARESNVKISRLNWVVSSN